MRTCGGRMIILFLLAFAFLFSCSHNSAKEPEDSPPEDFNQVGTASWYGDGFHGEETASGDFFDMYSCTAAHMTLPLGTMVRVSNLDNGREVFVKINDRGPYAGGRIIDLSRSAARSVGIDEEEGVAKVKVRVVSSFLGNYFRIKPIVLTVFASVLGIAGMGFVIGFINRTGLIKADMTKAISGILARPSGNTPLPGNAIHFAAALIVAFVYVAFIGPFFSCSIISSIGMGAVTGLLAGIIISSLLIFLLRKDYPSREEIYEVGFGVFATYLLGFFVYGIILGATAGFIYVMIF
jgi:rare lipoprotein A